MGPLEIRPRLQQSFYSGNDGDFLRVWVLGSLSVGFRVAGILKGFARLFFE